MKKVCLNVNGMYCHSCEVIIERKLKKVKGVEKAKVNRAKKKVDLECSCDVSLDELQKCLPDKYKLSQQHEKTHHKEERSYKGKWLDIGVSLIVLLGIYLALSHFDLLPSSFGLSESMSYGFILVIGLIASTSTCLAVAGGLLLAIATKYNEQHPELTGWQRFKPHIYFNIGRIIFYTLLGGAVGFIGSLFTLSLVANGIITIIASVLMILIGLQLLHVFPFLDHIHIKPPKFIAHRIHDASESEKAKYSNMGSFLFGGVTFFLPCGFTQALQLYVLAKGDFVTGALVMLAFALGTLPMLASIGAITSFAKGSIQRHFMTFSAILVIVLGVFSIQYGFALAGMGGESPLPNGNQASVFEDVGFAKIVDGKQIVEMKVVGLEYIPHQFKVKKGIPVEWRIDGIEAQGCGQVMTVPKLGLTEYFTKDGPKIIEFTPEEEGLISFACTMGMTTKGAAFEVIEG